MRLFEILLLAINGLMLIGWLRPSRRPRWLALLPAAALLFTLLHLLLEGYRWQMAPAYGLTAVTTLLALRHLARFPAGNRPRPVWQTSLGVCAGLVALLVASALPALLPVPALPPKTGPYPVGTFSLYLVDHDRADIYAAEPGAARELMAQFWYPAAPTGGEKAALLLPDLPAAGPVIARRFDLPPFLLNHVNLVNPELTISGP
jgi:hypothetical protein